MLQSRTKFGTSGERTRFDQGKVGTSEGEAAHGEAERVGASRERVLASVLCSITHPVPVDVLVVSACVQACLHTSLAGDLDQELNSVGRNQRPAAMQANQFAVAAGAAIAIGFGLNSFLDQCSKDAEDRQRAEHQEKVRKLTEEAQRGRQQGGPDKHRDELGGLVRRHKHKLLIDLLGEIKRRFEIKQENYAFRTIELPYLQTEGAADDPSAVVMSVALALGMDVFDLLAVPVYPHDLHALESLSLNTVQELHSILAENSQWQAEADILDTLVGGAKGPNGSAVSFLGICYKLMALGPYFYSCKIANPSKQRMSRMEAFAQRAGLCWCRQSSFRPQPTGKRDGDAEWIELLPRPSLDTSLDQDEVYISNFPLTKGFRILVTDERLVNQDVIFVKGARGWARATDKMKPDRDRCIDFMGRAEYRRHVYLLEQRLLSSGLVKSELADTHTSERVSIEHIAVLSGSIITIERELLAVMRCMMQERIEHRRDDFKKDLATDLTGLVSDLTAWQPDDHGDRQQEIAHFCEDYTRLLEMRLQLVPLFRGRSPSQMVPLTSIDSEIDAYFIMLFDPVEQRLACREVLKKREKARHVAARTAGSVPLGFDVVALGLFLFFCSVLFFISWKACENFGQFFRAVVWNPFKSVAEASLGRAGDDAGVWSKVFWEFEEMSSQICFSWIMQFVLACCALYFSVPGLCYVPKKAYILDLDKTSSNKEVIMRVRFAFYSWLAPRLGLPLPMARALAPLETRCSAQLHRWRADIARARFFAALHRGKIRVEEAILLLDTLAAAAESLRAEMGCLEGRRTRTEEAQVNLALEEGFCCFPGSTIDAERFLDLEIDDSAQIEQAPPAAALLLEDVFLGAPWRGKASHEHAAGGSSAGGGAAKASVSASGGGGSEKGHAAMRKPEKVQEKEKGAKTRITDHRKLQEVLVENGYLIDRHKKHWVFRRKTASGRVQVVTASSTPSDRRAYRQTQAQLARHNRQAQEDAEAAERNGRSQGCEVVCNVSEEAGSACVITTRIRNLGDGEISCGLLSEQDAVAQEWKQREEEKRQGEARRRKEEEMKKAREAAAAAAAKAKAKEERRIAQERQQQEEERRRAEEKRRQASTAAGQARQAGATQAEERKREEAKRQQKERERREAEILQEDKERAQQQQAMDRKIELKRKQEELEARKAEEELALSAKGPAESKKKKKNGGRKGKGVGGREIPGQNFGEDEGSGESAGAASAWRVSLGDVHASGTSPPPRPGGIAAGAAGAGGSDGEGAAGPWRCLECTFINSKPLALLCEMCCMPRGADPREGLKREEEDEELIRCGVWGEEGLGGVEGVLGYPAPSHEGALAFEMGENLGVKSLVDVGGVEVAEVEGECQSEHRMHDDEALFFSKFGM